MDEKILWENELNRKFQQHYSFLDESERLITFDNPVCSEPKFQAIPFLPLREKRLPDPQRSLSWISHQVSRNNSNIPGGLLHVGASFEGKKIKEKRLNPSLRFSISSRQTAICFQSAVRRVAKLKNVLLNRLLFTLQRDDYAGILKVNIWFHTNAKRFFTCKSMEIGFEWSLLILGFKSIYISRKLFMYNVLNIYPIT